MNILVETTTKRIVDDAFDRSAIPLMEFIRGDGEQLNLKFLKNGNPRIHPPGTTIKAVIKALGKYDSAELASVSSFTVPADSDPDNFYVAELPLNGAGLSALLFSGDGNTANDVPYIDAAFEIEWKLPTASLPLSTFAVPVRIHNDYNKPISTAPAVPSGWVELSAGVHQITGEYEGKVILADNTGGPLALVLNQIAGKMAIEVIMRSLASDVTLQPGTDPVELINYVTGVNGAHFIAEPGIPTRLVADRASWYVTNNTNEV